MTTASMSDPGNVAFVDTMYDKLMVGRGQSLPRLQQGEVLRICRLGKAALLGDPNLLRLDPPITIVGDIHGQFDALISILGPDPLGNGRRWLFLGDYVDRGPHSLEVASLLFVLKCKSPQQVFLTRGNHECEAVTKIYGFYAECMKWGSVVIWRTFLQVFSALPIAAVVGGKFFCVHGGISPGMSSLEGIDELRRPCDIPDEGLLCDLMWADPNTSPMAPPFMQSERCAGCLFSESAARAFLARFGFTLLVRCHQVAMGGYEWPFDEDGRVLTLFSAPNYESFANKAAVMLVDEGLKYEFRYVEP